MSETPVYFIVAMSKNRVIGVNNRLPWRLPADLQFFKQKTMGHTVVMGRKTFASIGRPLPGRKNVVLTRDPSFTAAGCAVVHSVGEALDECAGEEVYVIGGAEVFRQFYPYAAKMYVTLLDHEFAGDAFFPEIDENIWVQTEKRKGVTDEKNPYTYYFITYERKKFDVSPFAPGEAGLFH